jgi:hypothetical protein
MMVLVTIILVIVVTDFRSVVDGFSALTDGVTFILSPIKSVLN